MNHINRLLMKARRIASGTGMHILGFVDYNTENQKYTATVQVWDGVPGSAGDPLYSEHDTKEEAIAACDAIAAQYPNSEKITLIMDRGLED